MLPGEEETLGESQPPVGTHVVDTDTGRAGIVMGHEGPYVQLRPPGGGREWDAEPGAVRRTVPGERAGAEAAHPEAGDEPP